MKYQRFEDMPIWQEAGRLYQRVLDVIEEPNVPLSPTFRNQLERASLCISNCVAEAHAGLTIAETRSLLISARGAVTEVQSMVSIIVERPKVARLRDALQQIRAGADCCCRQLVGWKFALDNPKRSQQDSSQGVGTGTVATNAAPKPGTAAPRATG